MASRLKADEKNERIIRGLLKLPDNRRCLNCNSLGPQYVCTNFWTFVCTTCSGIHREFTHRVKSVSMAKFTSQEVSSLQEGGNKCAKEVYFKEWDPQRHSIPDSSNVDRLRDFIKHVYVDRRFSGERNVDKPPRTKMGDKEDTNENRRADTYQGGSRSPPYSNRSSPGGRSYGERSPGYEQELRQYGDYKRSPTPSNVVNDWRREDRFGNERISNGDAKMESRSPERPKDVDTFSPPMVCPVREILGDNIVPLRISGPPKADGGRTADGSAHTQRTASSSSLGSTNGNPADVKQESTGSLIDFDADPEPYVAAEVPQMQQPTVKQSAAIPTSSSNDNNWASFDFSPEAKVTQAPSNSLDSVLSQLSVSAPAPSLSGAPSGVGAQTPGPAVDDLFSVGYGANIGPTGHTLPLSDAVSVAAPNNSMSTFPPTVPGPVHMLPTNSGQWPNLQHQQSSMFPASSTQSNFTPSVGASSNQPWNFSPANAQGPLSTPGAQAPPAVSKPAQDLAFGAASQTPLEVKSSERKVLPEDLFSVNYSSMSAPVPAWQAGPPHGLGFNMQYNTGVPLPTFPQPSKSTNPFDVGNESAPVQAPAFPSMASMQGALPNVPLPSGIHRTSSLGTQPPTWMQPQPSSYASVMTPQAPLYASTMPPRPYMGQQVSSNMHPSRPQGFVGGGTAFTSLNPDQQLAGRYSAPATPNSFPSAGGNPFG